MEGRNSSETLHTCTCRHSKACCGVRCRLGVHAPHTVCMHCTYTIIMQSHPHWQTHPFPLAHAYMHAAAPTQASMHPHLYSEYTVCIYLHAYRDTSIEYTQSHNFGANIITYIHTSTCTLYAVCMLTSIRMYLLPCHIIMYNFLDVSITAQLCLLSMLYQQQTKMWWK